MENYWPLFIEIMDKYWSVALAFILPCFVVFPTLATVRDQRGETLFQLNCSVCHAGGNNIIIPEKNLKKETLEENGMNNLNAIVYQIVNGKNGMPAFGGRLTEKEIQEIATYLLEASENNFQD